MQDFQARQIGRHQATQAVTVGLGLAYTLGAFTFTPSSQLVAPGWIAKVSFWPSLALVGGTLYGCAWLGGGWAGAVILHRQRSAWRTGAACGVLTLLTAMLVGSGWNFGQEVVRFAPFPGTTTADYTRFVGDTFYDYVAKPLAWVMPLGSVLAAALGAWYGQRVRAAGSRASKLTASQV